MDDERSRPRRGNARLGLRRPLGRLTVVAVATLLLASGCGSTAGQPTTSAQGEPSRAMAEEDRRSLRTSGAPATLGDLADLGVLKAAFNEHSDVPQLILLLSPT